jgi:PAS domain S-box-containing protein
MLTQVRRYWLVICRKIEAMANIPRGPARTTSDMPFGLDLSMAAFDRATRLANSMFSAAGASIILVHNGEVWRSRYADILPSDDPITEAVLKGGELIWVADGRDHPLLKDHPLVTGSPFLRFTTAVPIRLDDGTTPGVLSVSGIEPQPYDATRAARLTDIADFIADEWTRAQAVKALADLIQEYYQALEQSERSEQRLQLALELSGLHVWEMDYEKRELIKAGAEETIFAEPLTYRDLRKDIYAAVDPRDRALLEEAWKKHLDEGSAYRPDFRVRRNDGREVWAQSAVKLFTDAAGKPTRMVGAIQNVTPRKRAEQALLAAKEEADAASRAKSEFLASMSHELRTPLNAILGFAEIMKEQIMGPAPAQYVEYARDIFDSGRHLLDLVNDVLDISKLEAGKVELRETEFDAGELVKEVIQSFARQAESAGIAIDLQLAALPALRADRRLLKQVLLNVASNALKFTQEGCVNVAMVSGEDGGLEISVTDTGIGMSKADIAVALTPFGQIDSMVARRHRGTGLGLPISAALMAVQGGHLTLESEPGKGTRATIGLPATRILRAAAVAS